MATKRRPENYLMIAVESEPEALEAAAVALTDLGAEGVIEEETAQGIRLIAYFPTGEWADIKPDLEKRLKQVSEYFPSLMLVEEKQAEDTDWLEAWKKFHKPVVIGPLWIGPPWQTNEAPPDKEQVIIDPANAFGTGGHTTTRLCLEAMAELYTGSESVADLPETMLDVGTGSGVLAIAGLKMGIKSALGTDIDEEALATAMENAAVNHVAGSFNTTTRSPGRLESTFPLVAANLTGPIHHLLADELIAAIEPGGYMLVSGILIDEANEIVELYRRLAEVIKIVRRGEWAGLVIHRV